MFVRVGSNLPPVRTVAQDEERVARIRENARWLRDALLAHGATLVTSPEQACDAGITFIPKSNADARVLGETLEQRGYLLNFRSAHLQSRNWIQLSLLGDPTRASLEHFMLALDSCASVSDDQPLETD